MHALATIHLSRGNVRPKCTRRIAAVNTLQWRVVVLSLPSLTFYLGLMGKPLQVIYESLAAYGAITADPAQQAVLPALEEDSRES